MNKLLVAVFENESAAYEGLSALKELDGNSDIKLYASAVINKNERGELELKTVAYQRPQGLTTGLFTGSLIGLFGGPMGLAVGAATGTLAGAIFDLGTQEPNTRFATDVSKSLANGQTAIVAEIEESWTVPVDAKLHESNAIVYRRLKSEVVEDQLASESKAIVDEYEKLKDELREARDERKAEIKSTIAGLERKAQAVNNRIGSRLTEIENKFEEKINVIQQQIQPSSDRRKAKRKKNLSEMKKESKVRIEKLKKASGLIKEAFDPKGIPGKLTKLKSKI